MGSKYRDLTRQMARWCDIPAPSSPFLTDDHAIITHEAHKEYRGPSSLYIESQDSLVAHGPIVLRRPGNGREAPIVKRQKCNPEKSYKVLKI
jgi:hypothetical protein